MRQKDSKPQKNGQSTHNPILWASALAILLVFGAVSYRIVTSCEESSFDLLNNLKVNLGGCPKQPKPARTDTQVRNTDPSAAKVAIAAKTEDTRAVTCPPFNFSARQYSNALNIGVGTLSYGEVITNGGDGSKDQENMVEFSFKVDGNCNYRLDVEYAAEGPRPVVISLNGDVINQNGLSEKTGGWGLANQKTLTQGAFTTKPGVNKLRFYRSSVFPHIRSVHLVPTPT